MTHDTHTCTHTRAHTHVHSLSHTLTHTHTHTKLCNPWCRQAACQSFVSSTSHQTRLAPFPHGSHMGQPDGAHMGQPHGAHMGKPHGAHMAQPHGNHTCSRRHHTAYVPALPPFPATGNARKPCTAAPHVLYCRTAYPHFRPAIRPHCTIHSTVQALYCTFQACTALCGLCTT